MSRALFRFVIQAVISLVAFYAKAQQANFSADVQSGCFPLVVNFTDGSIGSPTGWQWNFGNGNASTLQNPSAIYTSAGVYTVTLTVSKGAVSDAEVKTGYIIVHGFPIVNFNTSVTVGCAPLSLSFIDQTNASEGEIEEWFWVFGDGASSTEPNPSHVYALPGTQSVSLKATNEFGCESTKSVLSAIDVKGPVVNFSPDITTVCQVPVTINFTNESVGGASLTYLWNFGDGETSTSIDPSHNFATPGVYDVQLTATDEFGCQGFHAMAINAGSEGGIDFEVSKSTVCVGEEINVTTQTMESIVSIAWSYGNGNGSFDPAPAFSYLIPGTYTVRLDAVLQGKTCHSIVQKTIQVLPSPASSFEATSDCAYAITLQSTSPYVGSVEWFVNDTFYSNAFVFVYAHGQPGDVKVRLVTYNALGCPNSAERIVHVTANPSASFSPKVAQDCTLPSLSGCAPFSIPFKDETQSEVAYTVQWQFGNGKTSIVKNPNATYLNPGVYKVKLTVSSTRGCVSVDSAIVTVSNVTPTAKFSVPKTSYCSREQVLFKDESANATYWCWDFGDGTTGSGQDPIHSYAVPGSYTVTLTAKNAGCTNVFKINNVIHVNDPFVDFTIEKNCLDPFTIDLTNNSTQYDSLIWNFGDGFTSLVPTNSHHYAAEGNYLVGLTAVSNTTQCRAKLEIPILIQTIVAKFEINNLTPCKEAPVVFTDSSDNAVVWDWSFGNDQFSNFQNNQIAYSAAGMHEVRLRVTDSDGCVDELIKNVVVPDIQGNFSFQATSTCAALTVHFTDLSTASPSIDTWHWSFGDGSTSTVANPDHVYTALGNYPIVLTLTNAVGQCSFIKEDAIAFTNPTPDFSAIKSNFCIDDLVVFSNLSTDADTYLWNFGDGKTSVDFAPAIRYPQRGTYALTLHATDIFGCQKSVTKPGYLSISKPTADFDAFTTSGECPPLTSIFQNKSSSDVIQFNWDFGDGQSSSIVAPANTYTKAGMYDVALIVTNGHLCTDTVLVEDLVQLGGPSGNFLLNELTTCVGRSIDFEANAENTVLLEWDFGDGVVKKVSASSMTHLYENEGTYNPSLILEDQFGCRVLADGSYALVVNDSAKVEMKIPSCIFAGEASVFEGVQQEDITWKWNINGLLSEERSPRVVFDSAGHYTIFAQGVNSAGCEGRYQADVTVHGDIDFLPNVITPNDDGKNDSLVIAGLDKSAWNFLLFNRWGQKVYESKHAYSNDWSGDGLGTGVYFMVLENLVCRERQYKQFIHIVR